MQLHFSSKSFKGRRILEELTLNLPDKKVTVVLGPSGVGKTTLLRLVAGLDVDDAGTRLEHQRVGFVFQEPRLLPWLTVRENIEIVAEEAGWLTRLGLDGTDSLYPRQLSLGMARRVALARAIAYRPTLLVLDEPLASLDAATLESVRDVLKRVIEAEQITTLMVTHDFADAKIFGAQALKLEGRPAKLKTI